jgi:hypothetical protein
MNVKSVNVHAICLTLGEGQFLPASLGAVYPFVSGITVVTTFDRDWSGKERDPDGTAELVLSRRLDPKHKMQLVVLNETSEARSRNRAMDLSWGLRASRSVVSQASYDLPPDPIDYFLILDSDEIWEHDALAQALEIAVQTRRPVYTAAMNRYFRSWNNRIDGEEWGVVLMRSDVRANWLRHRRRPFPLRALARFPGVPHSLADRLRGAWRLPSDRIRVHHGSYVGDLERLRRKIESFGHANEVPPGWLERVAASPPEELRNFHPTHPTLFPRITRLSTADLPDEIVGADWPAGYLDLPP